MTERNSDLAQLRSSESRLRSIVESAVDGIIVIDARGAIEAFNRGAERLFGYTPAEVIGRILDTAVPFVSVAERDVKKVPLLRGKTVFNLFFENSTRTRTTFEIAAKRLSADVINLNIGVSSTSKGETLLDTIDNLVAMNADMFVVRHGQSGAPHLIARHLSAAGQTGIHVINAGDGRHAHPTQGLLDLFTIRHYKHEFSRLTVAIVGDLLHSLFNPWPDHTRHAGGAGDRSANAPSGGDRKSRSARIPRHGRRFARR